jgi:hypothetical protein
MRSSGAPPVNATVLATAVLFLFTADIGKAALVTNGSFEAVQITTPFSSNPTDIPGWTHTGDQGDALLWKAGPQCCGGTNTAKAGDGNQFVTMGGGFGPFGSSAWSQTISGLTAGQSYDVNFLVAAEGETATQTVTVGFTSGSLTAPETFTTPMTNTLFWQNWGAEQYVFVPTASSAVLQFSVTQQQYDVGLDGISIAPASGTAAPEPGGFWLAGMVFCVAGAMSARKRFFSLRG